ncbi:MAG: hypothetical protein KAT90_06660 [Gammaproteobacteria bacterium]|nr:hypothetical protein [Gammaproteobacteria bacterium]
MAEVTEIVYQGRGNVNLVLFKEGVNNTPVDFTASTRFVLTLGSDVVDTDIASGSITTTAVAGELKFDLGLLGLTIGMKYASLVVFDPAHPEGQVLSCPISKNLSFNVVDCAA